MKGALAAARTGETLFKPLYRGSGELYLEPTFGHFWLRQMEEETLFADQGLFFCCEDSVKVEAHKVESFSARMAGGEGRYQTKVSGAGMVVFRIPVPRSEIVELELRDETLQVDGSFALLQTFRGSGRVWIAPTQPLYEKMRSALGSAGGKAAG